MCEYCTMHESENFKNKIKQGQFQEVLFPMCLFVRCELSYHSKQGLMEALHLLVILCVVGSGISECQTWHIVLPPVWRWSLLCGHSGVWQAHQTLLWTVHKGPLPLFCQSGPSLPWLGHNAWIISDHQNVLNTGGGLLSSIVEQRISIIGPRATCSIHWMV